MRIAVVIVFCLVLTKAAQTSSSSPSLPVSAFNCEELTSHIQTLKESTRTKKDKFSCILNLLKSALTDELETTHCREEINNKKLTRNVIEDEISDSDQTILDNETERKNPNGAEKESNDKLLLTHDKMKNSKNSTQNFEIPTMIPIFKPKPVIRNNFDNTNIRPRPIPVRADAVHLNSNPITNAPRFTIPCQRAADVLDMSAVPRETDRVTVQMNLDPKSIAPESLSENQKPMTVVHCADSDESVAIMFKPKSISLTQLYGNLLKKLTFTVLVPYHMSKMGQQ